MTGRLLRAPIFVAALAASVSLAARQQTASPGDTVEQGQPGDRVRLMGCVQPTFLGRDAPSGAIATPQSSTTGGGQYILADATLVKGDEDAAALAGQAAASRGGTANAAAEPGSGTGRTYNLIAIPFRLANHAGHWVEVSGTLQPSEARRTGNPAPVGTTGDPSPRGTAGAPEQAVEAMPGVQVDTITHIRPGCFEQ